MGYDDWKADVGDWPSGEDPIVPRYGLHQSVVRAFWSGFRVEQRRGIEAALAFINRHRPYGTFATLVDAAEHALIAPAKVYEDATRLDPETREVLALKGMLD